ncbi:MAG: hypothetical protein IJR96_04125 [Pseudobutyrivibrio sp.]|nr:hypothetical protein [Pseudobutyrivibrio sp.]
MSTPTVKSFTCDDGKNYTIPNCSITKVHYKNGEYTLESIADTQYINEDVDK